ncbi:capsular polysaccharide export protein, LipB/KpsS family [Lelliottia wanjuensis]|uniref:Capsular biosynthesis protein n=1 Tax=Lelliottia wanjuensis TaxID=3050585 RepID=A0AAP4D4I7_9ENTR|nr:MULTISPECIES: hypothetical protein [unclassified Lelliottia]MDK9364989.1 hypothetical protein [Lelliottia sp. V106_12]MDK9618823.1 hypothetical protein [Lelliottia sp. V106_9]
MIGFYMETIENAQFYSRVINALPADEQQAIVAISPWEPISEWLSENLSDITLCRIAGEMNLPTPDAFQQQKPTLFSRIDSDIRGSREFLIQKLEYQRCWNIYLYILLQLMNKPELNGLRKMILCSGNGLAEQPAALFCQQRNITTRFVELSNFPNKVFVDQAGSNARSALALNPKCLDALPDVPEDFHTQWMIGYEAEKRQPPLQARNNPCEKLIAEISQDRVLGRQRGFIFLPLQVSYDTQLWLNADLRNEEAVRHASRLARQEKRDLVVKIHPAETEPSELVNIAKLQQRYKFKVTQENTLDLIKASSRVVTINSTVGLEAKLYHKPVEVLGRAFYQNFSHEQLKKYLHRYLFTGVEVRASAPIPADIARAFIRH